MTAKKFSLLSLHDHDVKVPNFTFSELRYSLLGFNSRKTCQHLTNWKKCGISAIKFETARIHFLSDWQWRFCSLKLRSTPNLTQEKQKVKVAVMSFASFQLNIYTLINLEMTSKLSKLKWKHKPLACRRVQVSLQSFEHFYVISMVEKNGDCWELFSIVFFSFWYGDVYFILENRVRGENKQNCCAIMKHQNCSVTVKKTFPHMLTNLKLSGEYYLFVPIVLCLCCFPSF